MTLNYSPKTRRKEGREKAEEGRDRERWREVYLKEAIETK